VETKNINSDSDSIITNYYYYKFSFDSYCQISLKIGQYDVQKWCNFWAVVQYFECINYRAISTDAVKFVILINFPSELYPAK